MVFRTSTIFLFLVLCFSKTPAQRRLRFEWFAHDAGMSQHNISSLLRDKNGFVWMGTQDGLNRYDGYQFTAYRNDLNDPHSLSHKWIDFVADGGKGILWVVAGRKLNRFNTLTQRAERFAYSPKDSNSVSSDFISCVLVDHAGLVWVGTNKGLNAFDYRAKKWKHFFHRSDDSLSISDNNIQCLYEDKKGTLWIGTANGLNYYNKNVNRFVHYNHQHGNSNSLSDYWVRCVTEDNDGTLWIGTGKGLSRFNISERKFTSYRHKAGDENSLSSDNISGIVEDKQGILWVTTDKGLNLFDKKTFLVTQYHPVIGDNQSLHTEQLQCIWKDQEDIIWIGSADGLHKYNPRIDRFAHYAHNPQDKNSLSFRSVCPIHEDKEGILWIGTTGGGLNRFDRRRNQWTHYRHNPNDPNSISHDDVWHLIEDHSGKLWIMTIAALDCMDKKTGNFIHYFPNDKDPEGLHGSTAVHEVLEDHYGNIWVATDRGLNKLNVKTGKFQHFKHDQENNSTIGSDVPSCIKEARNGNLLIGTFGNGLDIYQPVTNTFLHFVHREGDSTSLNNQNVYCTHEDRNGRIWIGGDVGIDCLDPVSGKVIVHYREKNGLPNETVYRIEQDQKDRLWLSTNKGIAYLTPATHQIKTFDVSDGLQGLEFNGYGSGQSKKTGELFFGGINGVTAFYPDSIQTDSYKPVVMITKMRRFRENASLPVEETMLDKNAIMLSYQENVIALEFLSLSLSKPAKNQYAYQLKGFSDQWYPLGTKREITFAGLPPGSYTLLVKGSNGDGIWNDVPTALSLTILPPWWRTWWAYTLYATAIITGVVLFIHYRSRHLKTENMRLEQKVKARTHALKQSLDELKATQAQLIHSEKMASLGELTAGIAHEIQNPLNFVNNFSELNKEMIAELKGEIDKGNYDEVKNIAADIEANEEKIAHHGKRADAIVKGMLQHSRKNSGEREPTDINALADEYLRLSYHGMRAKDKTFNADFKTHFDETIGKINIVPQDMGRVLLNLFNNAFYAVHEKRKTHTKNYQPAVSVTTRKTATAIEIVVQDNGMGILKSVQDKIFQPFFTTKPTGQGTGLGLSLSYDIVKAHSGELNVESTEGEGATFRIHLPRA